MGEEEEGEGEEEDPMETSIYMNESHNVSKRLEIQTSP